MHYFYYNAFRKPWVHSTANRQDTFCCDHRLRLSEIKSIQHFDLDSAVRQKKVIRYDRVGQKCAALMFIFDEETNRYRLTDSTVYAYQDTTIIRTTYHFALAGERKAVAAAVALETDIFLYNRKGNLVKKIDGDVLGGTSEKIYDDYDDAPNPYRLLNWKAWNWSWQPVSVRTTILISGSRWTCQSSQRTIITTLISQRAHASPGSAYSGKPRTAWFSGFPGVSAVWALPKIARTFNTFRTMSNK
jgi:hypothetical protein